MPVSFGASSRSPFLSKETAVFQLFFPLLRVLIASLLAASAAAFAPLHAAPGLRFFTRARSAALALDMKVAVFGASGLTGAEVAYQALQRGQGVVALARTPSKVTKPQGSCGAEAVTEPLTDANLKVIAGSVTNQEDVDAVFAEGDITSVIVSLGGKTADVGETMLTDGTSKILSDGSVILAPTMWFKSSASAEVSQSYSYGSSVSE